MADPKDEEDKVSEQSNERNEEQKRLNEALYDAAKEGSIEDVQEAIANGAWINYQGVYEETPLWTAVDKGHEKIVQMLLDNKADPNIPEYNKQTPLYTAAYEGHENIVRMLLDNKADPNIPDKDNETPLYTAAYKGHENIVRMLLDNKADPNIPNEDNETPLWTAADKGHENIVRMLLDNKADPNIPDKNKQTPLYTAAYQGHENIVRMLLDNKADPNIHVPDKNKETPLYTAANEGHENIVRMLLDNKADPNIPDEDGWSALHVADNVETYRLLVSHGASQDAVTNDGDTISHTVCKYDSSVGILEYLINQGLFKAEALNNDNKTPVDIASKACQTLLKEKGLYEGPVTAEALAKVHHGISETTGRMKVGRVLLHGPPRVGKTSVKRLTLGQPPMRQDSTGLIEDPIRAISTARLRISDKATSLEEMDEKRMITMIQCEVQKAAKGKKKKSKLESRPSINNEATDGKHSNQPVHTPASTAGATPQSTSTSTTEQTPHSTTIAKKNQPRSKVLSKIAADLDSIDSGAPSLFACKHVHLIDSGGQPEFSNILPLIFPSQSHHHMVVIRLDEKFSDKPRNCFEISGVKHVFPESLLLTNYQLIERLCQLAASSNSLVIVIGTHLDQENVEEPLAKKNELLEPLVKKYEGTLAVSEEGEPIFAVNAMAPEGPERTNYAEMLREIILSAPVLTDEGNDCGDEEGMVVPLRWIILELELSRRTKEVGILDKAEIKDIAESLEVADLDQALAFFKKLAIHYHYPEVLPNKIFTSTAPISSRLSKVVEATFPDSKPFVRKDPDQVRLQKSGELTRKLLKKVAPSLKTIDDQFSVEEFVSLMKYLRVVFEIEDGALLFPGLLPLEAHSTISGSEYHQEPLFLFWLNENDGKVRILPQSFFHALVVELLRREEVVLNTKAKHSRTSFTFDVTVKGSTKRKMILSNYMFWMELKLNKFSKKEECPLIKDIIQASTKKVLDQLKLTGLGTLKYGVRCASEDCEIEYSHPGECTDHQELIFSCAVSEEETSEWKETNEEKLFWVKDNNSATNEPSNTKPQISSSSAPTTSEVFDILEERSAKWDEIGRKLQITQNYRENLAAIPNDTQNKKKLEALIEKWIESETRCPVTWQTLKDVLLELDMKDLVKEHLSHI